MPGADGWIADSRRCWTFCTSLLQPWASMMRSFGAAFRSLSERGPMAPSRRFAARTAGPIAGEEIEEFPEQAGGLVGVLLCRLCRSANGTGAGDIGGACITQPRGGRAFCIEWRGNSITVSPLNFCRSIIGLFFDPRMHAPAVRLVSGCPISAPSSPPPHQLTYFWAHASSGGLEKGRGNVARRGDS